MKISPTVFVERLSDWRGWFDPPVPVPPIALKRGEPGETHGVLQITMIVNGHSQTNVDICTRTLHYITLHYMDSQCLCSKYDDDTVHNFIVSGVTM